MMKPYNRGDNASNTPSVEYDHRALIIDGKRRILISGSIHYPRSTPQMWPKLVKLAKDGGLDVIQTYVFWDGHEQQRGKLYFQGRYDLVRFLQIIHDAGLYVNLRIGPYICAEWNFGGLPEWLREIPGIELRTNNELFKNEMQRFVSYIVQKMKDNNLFYTQGGPIILAQVENEYGMIEAAYGDAGYQYAMWAANMAVNLNTTVPWIMCKQTNAPENIIDTCNGFYCDSYTPNSHSKPKMWTENWTGWFHYWGVPRPNRPVEDLAYATARFFQKGGSLVNYYMYHGGTNFGRTSAAGVTTSYDYDAPIDEYGQARQPKWGHLKDLHVAIKLCEPAMAIVDGEAIHWSPPGLEVEIYVYYGVYPNDTDPEIIGSSPYQESPNGKILCAAFVSNSGRTSVTLKFLGQSYFLPAWSVSILPDCRNEVFNTAKVSTQTSVPKMVMAPVLQVAMDSPEIEAEVLLDTSEPFTVKMQEAAKLNVQQNAEVEGDADKNVDGSLNDTQSAGQGPRDPPDSALKWTFARDIVGSWGNSSTHHQGLLEQINVTHDLTDYLWYITTIDIPQDQGLDSASESSDHYPADYDLTSNDHGSSLTIEVVRDVVSVFVNDKPAGGYPTWTGNGTGFLQPLSTLQPGNNTVALLSATTGLQYAGPFYDHEVGGLSGSVMLKGVPRVPKREINLTNALWTYQVGLSGEYLQDESSDFEVGVRPGLNWSSKAHPSPINEPLVWYKTSFDVAPGNDGPLVLDLSSMRKGAVWVNGHHLGRYWPAMYNPKTGCDNVCDYRGTYSQSKCMSECGQPSQQLYHVPREWLHFTNNQLVLFEEIGGNITGVSFWTQVIDVLCSNISETHPPQMKFSNPTRAAKAEFPVLRLDCGVGYHIEKIEFASFGNPSGTCGQFVIGSCHAPRSADVVQEACGGRQFCSISVHKAMAGDDPCPNTIKWMAVEATCQASSLR